MAAPFEMVSGPLEVFWAPEDTLAPELSATPSAPWLLLGANGQRSISDDGLSVSFDETVESQRVLGSTGIQKQFRTEEDVMLSFALLDVSADTFAFAMSGLTVTPVAPGVGAAGYQHVPLFRGFPVVNLAFLARGKSPYNDDLYAAQFWLPKGYASFSGELQYTKGQAAEISIEVMAIESTSHQYGQYQAQDAPPA